MPYAPRRKPQELLTSANAILGQGQLSLAKYLLIIAKEDAPDLDIHDISRFFTHLLESVPVVFFFSYFFALVGGVMMVMGIADYFGRGQYRRRIDELEERRSVLRQRMFEAYVS